MGGFAHLDGGPAHTASGEAVTAEVVTRLVTNEETGRYAQVDGVLGFTKEAAL